jgi:hypothetical protein
VLLVTLKANNPFFCIFLMRNYNSKNQSIFIKISLLSALFFSLLAATPVFSKILKQESKDGLVCANTKKYLVVAIERKRGVGSDFLVKRLKNGQIVPKCKKYGQSWADFVIVNQNAEYFFGLKGKWLLLDSGTSPQRALVLWDLEDSKKVFGSRYASSTSTPVSLTIKNLTFWQPMRDKATRALCPSYEYTLKSAEVYRKVQLTLTEFTLKDLGQIMCQCGGRGCY